MLLPLDASGKLPKSVIPFAAQTLTTVNGQSGDATGNISIVSGNANLTVAQNNNVITLTAAGGSGGITTVQAGPGLTGGGSTPIVELHIKDFGIGPNMLGLQSVTARTLDQNIPQWGLWQDPIGQINVGVNNSLTFVPAQPNAQVPGMPTRTAGQGGAVTSNGIGINLSNTNNWLVVQNFLGGLTGSLGVFGTLGTNANVITANGLAEPNSSPSNSAVAYEILNNGDLKVTGTTTIMGNTYIGSATNGGINQMGTVAQSANTIQGLTNAVSATGSGANNVISASSTTTTNASNTITVTGSGTNNQNNITATSSGAGASSNNITASGTGVSNTNTITASGTSAVNSIQAPTNNIGTASGNVANNIGTFGSATNTIGLAGSGTNSIQALTNNIGTGASSTNTIGNGGTSTNTIQGTNNTMTATGGTGTNTITGTVSNSIQAPTNSIGTTNASSTNTIGNVGSSNNTMTGLNNTITGGPAGTNSFQAPTTNIGTANASSAVTIGNAGTSTNTIQGLTDNIQGNTINVGTTTASNVINVGGSAATVAGGTSTTFNGNVVHQVGGAFVAEPNAASAGSVTNYELRDLGDLQVSGSTNLIGNTYLNQTLTVGGATIMNGGLTVHGPFTQDLGNAQIAGSTTNTFGTVAGANNTIGGTNTTNTVTGLTNTFTTSGTGAAGNGNRFNGDIWQVSGLSRLLTLTVGTGPADGTITSFGNLTLATASTNNVIGNNPGTNAGSTNTIQGYTNTFNASGTNGATNSMTATSASPANNITATGSNALNTMSATGLNGANTINATLNNNITATNNNLTGVLTQIGNGFFGDNISSFTTTFRLETLNGNNNSSITNFTTIAANNSVSIGTPASNVTTLMSNTNGTPVNVNLPNVTGSSRIPTFQSWQLNLNPATPGPDGGASVTFNAGTVTPNPLFNYFVNSGSAVSVRYVGHNAGSPSGQLFVFISGTNVQVESTSPFDNNRVEITIMTP